MPKSKGTRKHIRKQRVQTIKEPDTVMRRNYKGEMRPVPNPVAGEQKTIYHTPVLKENK
jgi:hypothetical protein